MPDQWEMYDLKNDPLEKRNLAYRPDRRTAEQDRQFKRLRAKLEKVERERLS